MFSGCLIYVSPSQWKSSPFACFFLLVTMFLPALWCSFSCQLWKVQKRNCFHSMHFAKVTYIDLMVFWKGLWFTLCKAWCHTIGVCSPFSPSLPPVCAWENSPSSGPTPCSRNVSCIAGLVLSASYYHKGVFLRHLHFCFHSVYSCWGCHVGVNLGKKCSGVYYVRGHIALWRVFCFDSSLTPFPKRWFWCGTGLQVL